jgi:transcriptional regulator with XRE-family HTH domain
VPLIIKTNIKAYLNFLKLTSKQLSALSGVSQTTISSAITGSTNPTLETLYYISDIFNCSIADLLDENKAHMLSKKEKDLRIIEEAKDLDMLTDKKFMENYKNK